MTNRVNMKFWRGHQIWILRNQYGNITGYYGRKINNVKKEMRKVQKRN